MKERYMNHPVCILLLSLAFFVRCNAKNGSRFFDSSDKQTSIGDTVSQTHDSILVVFQDSKNYYWFGSNGHGVYRYDGGKKFIHYTTKHGLSGNHIWKIQEDKSGNIFFTTTTGICRYDGKQFIILPLTPNDSANQGWKLQEDDLWFQGAQDSGVVYRYDGQSLYRLVFPKTKIAETFITDYPRDKFPAMAFSPYDVYSTFRDRKGNMWFGTGMLGVCRYDGKTFTWIPNEKIGMDKVAFCVRSIIEDKQGKFWFSNTMHRYNVNDILNIKEETGINQAYGQQQENDYDYFMSGFEDSNGDFWLATFGTGIWKYNGKTMINYPVMKAPGRIATVYSIYKDRQGNLWLGTHTGGAYKFNGNDFEKFRP